MRVAITARSVALELLNKVSHDDAYANLVMPTLLDEAKLPPRDSALAQELAFSTLRWQLNYDKILDRVSSRPVNEIDAVLLNALRLGCHQLLRMRIPAHAAINETVNLIRSTSGEKVVGFANGLLRRVSEKSLNQWLDLITQGISSDTERMAIEYSHPEWIVRALKQTLTAEGRLEDLSRLLESNNDVAKVNLVALPGLASRESFIREGAIPNLFSPFGFSIDSGNPADLEEIRTGSVRVQDEGSQLVALALASYGEVTKSEKWLDMCAGPGGKAALLAALARESSALLVANEVQPHRAKLVEKALKPYSEVAVSIQDGRVIGDAMPNSYDRILIDAPCTGLGALRRRPEARWRKSVEDLKDLTKLQFELLESGLKALKPGGLLLYATCSPHQSETTAVIEKAQRLLGAEVLDLTSHLSRTFMAGTLPINRRTIQLFTDRDGTDCMFMALITK